MFSNTFLFVAVSLLFGVISGRRSVTKNGLTFKVDGDSYNISYANIPTLREGAISDIDDMTKLLLSYDNINTIEPGAFQDLPNLRNLEICFNDILSIEAGVFNDLNLTTLDIGFNNIFFIASHAFDNMKNLESIIMAGNRLNRWDVLWFVRTPSLYAFHLPYNQFKKIPANAFGMQERTDDFYFIDLEDNKMVEIDDDAFKGFTKITVLYIDLKKHSLLKGHFLRGIEIEELYITVDGIRCLSKEIASEEFMAEGVTLNGNSTDIFCKNRIDEVQLA